MNDIIKYFKLEWPLQKTSARLALYQDYEAWRDYLEQVESPIQSGSSDGSSCRDDEEIGESIAIRRVPLIEAKEAGGCCCSCCNR